MTTTSHDQGQVHDSNDQSNPKLEQDSPAVADSVVTEDLASNNTDSPTSSNDSEEAKSPILPEDASYDIGGLISDLQQGADLGAADLQFKSESSESFEPDSPSRASIMKDGTMLSEGHTAIMGLENRPVHQYKDVSNTYITGASAEELEVLKRIQAMNTSNRTNSPTIISGLEKRELPEESTPPSAPTAISYSKEESEQDYIANQRQSQTDTSISAGMGDGVVTNLAESRAPFAGRDLPNDESLAIRDESNTSVERTPLGAVDNDEPIPEHDLSDASEAQIAKNRLFAALASDKRAEYQEEHKHSEDADVEDSKPTVDDFLESQNPNDFISPEESDAYAAKLAQQESINNSLEGTEGIVLAAESDLNNSEDGDERSYYGDESSAATDAVSIALASKRRTEENNIDVEILDHIPEQYEPDTTLDESYHMAAQAAQASADPHLKPDPLDAPMAAPPTIYDDSQIELGDLPPEPSNDDYLDDMAGIVAPLDSDSHFNYIDEDEGEQNSLEENVPQYFTPGMEIPDEAVDDPFGYLYKQELNQQSEPQYELGASEPSNESDDGPIYPGVYADRLVNPGKDKYSQPEASSEMQNAVEQAPMAQMERGGQAAQVGQMSPIDPMAQATPDSIIADGELPQDESDVNPVPAGMGDGVLSQVELNPHQGHDSDYDGPQYKVGPTVSSAQAHNNDIPIYAVGAGRSNAEVLAQAMAARNQLAQQRGEYDESLEDNQAYEEALAQAARESMAAPQSEVIKRARAMAADLSQESTKSDLNTKETKPNESDNYDFEHMPNKEHIGIGMVIFLYIRQLIASLFTHTTLPIVAPHLAMRLGPCYPSSMVIPFFLVGFVAGLSGSIANSIVHLESGAACTFLIYLLLTGLSAYRGIYRMCTYATRRRHDHLLLSASLTVPMLAFLWILNNLFGLTNGIVETTLAFAFASMLSAATASSLMWGFPQDPLDSSGIMTTRGLLFVTVICLMASFGLLHYIVGLSVLGVSVVMRLIFGYALAKNQGTAQRPYVYALQLLTLFAVLLDFILLKSQDYELLSQSTLEFVQLLRTYSSYL